jgi:hypothetical protein
MARLEILRPDAIDDPELRRMALASGDEMYGVYGHCPELFAAFLRFYRPAKYGGRLHRTFGVAPMGPRSHAVLERGYDA